LPAGINLVGEPCDAQRQCLPEQVKIARMPQVAPLTPTEEALWRALMRLVFTLHRALDEDLIRARGMTANEYTVLMNLSEAPNRELRITDLADASALSVSRMSRLVDDLQSRNLVAKRRSEIDGRGNVASLTQQGMTRLEAAYPDHLASARRLVLDHVDRRDLAGVTRTLELIATQLNEKAARERPRRTAAR
jgi:DNA-binding MarR family transcriptional regulator